MPSFTHVFTKAFGLFAYAATWITLYRLYGFLHPSRQLLAASNQALWRIGLVCLLFVIQHSAMATPQWKSFWASSSFAIAQRSAHALSSAALLEVMMFFWLASPTIVWNLESPIVASICKYAYPIGWGVAIYQLVALNHFELFGLAQTLGRVHVPVVKTTKAFEHAQLPHPIFLPWVVVLFAVPRMSFDRLILAVGAAVYLLVRNNVRPADWTRPL